MTASVGRNVTLTWGGAGIAGVKEKSFTLNNERSTSPPMMMAAGAPSSMSPARSRSSSKFQA